MPSTAIKRNSTSTVPIDTIYASPENDEIYGAIDTTDIDLVNLAIDISENGIREPQHIFFFDTPLQTLGKQVFSVARRSIRRTFWILLLELFPSKFRL